MHDSNINIIARHAQLDRARRGRVLDRTLLPFAFLAVFCGVGALVAFAQPLRSPDPVAPKQAYQQLLAVQFFAFGGIGYTGRTSDGEIAYRAITESTNALALFSATFTNGNAQAKLYALCGIRQLAPGKFDAYAQSLRTSNPMVETMQGCIASQEFSTNVISRIARGAYDPYFQHRKR